MDDSRAEGKLCYVHWQGWDLQAVWAKGDQDNVPEGGHETESRLPVGLKGCCGETLVKAGLELLERCELIQAGTVCCFEHDEASYD